ncbi:hypothetical protein [Marinifilum sp.]|uniref:hypothetical protein n=1 Tax=Marinifilum sp. TaxID=2033137 RepID=UPI003BAA4E2E
MDHKLLLQLLQNKTEEIQSLLEHFKNHPEDLNNGLDLLSDRIVSLSKEFRLMQDRFDVQKPEVEITKEIERAKPEGKAKLELTANSEIAKPEEEAPKIKTEPIKVTKKDKAYKQNAKAEQDSILNDQLQSNSAELIGDKIKNNKLSDIQTAIGINDRFLFIRELFDNKTEAYNSSINFINQTNSYKLIEEHFKSQTNWDFEDPTVIQFMELTKRKF